MGGMKTEDGPWAFLKGDFEEKEREGGLHVFERVKFIYD